MHVRFHDARFLKPNVPKTPPPKRSQPLRSRILRNALKDNLEEWEIEDPEGSETQVWTRAAIVPQLCNVGPNLLREIASF